MKTKCKLVFLFLLITLTISAQKDGFGIGIILGDPTGLSAKKFVGNAEAFDAGAAWSFRDDAALHLHADYLYHDYSLIKVKQGKLPVYYGIGGRIKLEDDPLIGVRIPVGLAYELANSPIDFFFEIVPILDLAPETEFDLNGAIGMRFYL